MLISRNNKLAVSNITYDISILTQEDFKVKMKCKKSGKKKCKFINLICQLQMINKNTKTVTINQELYK